MTDKQNVIIAKWMGWRWLLGEGGIHLVSPDDFVRLTGFGWNIAPTPDDLEEWDVPKFSTDLNAMASALAVVKERGLEREYNCSLFDVVSPEKETLDRQIIFKAIAATAAQQAEALVRVIEQEGER